MKVAFYLGCDVIVGIPRVQDLAGYHYQKIQELAATPYKTVQSKPATKKESENIRKNIPYPSVELLNKAIPKGQKPLMVPGIHKIQKAPVIKSPQSVPTK